MSQDSGPYVHEREFTRIPIDLCATVEVDGETTRYDRPRDLAMRGIYLFTEEPLAEGTHCRVTLEMGDEESALSIGVQGRVVRSEASGMAIEFTGLTPDAYLHLRNLILYNADNKRRVEEELSSHLGIGERR